MPRHTDGSLMTVQQQQVFDQAEFDSNIELLESLNSKDLYNTGPRYTRDGMKVTSFSPDRWSKYIDELSRRGEVEKAKQLADALAAKKAQPKEAKEVSGPLTIEWTDESGNKSAVGKRNLSGNRDDDGNLLTAEDEALTAKIRADQEKFKGEFTDNPLTANRAGETRDANKEAINKKWAKRREDIAAAVEAAKQKDLHSAREEASLENVPDWLGQSEGAISDEDRDRLVQEDVAREAAEFDAQLEDADSDRVMMEADVDADKLDDEYEANEFPMLGMSDEDKGMFQFKKTESKEDKNIDAGIDAITQDTGMNEEQARQLMTKLKGICG